MTDVLALWVELAKSPVPLTAAQIGRPLRDKNAAARIHHMHRAGQIERRNVDGKARYVAVASPKGLTLADIVGIAEAIKDNNAKS